MNSLIACEPRSQTTIAFLRERAAILVHKLSIVPTSEEDHPLRSAIISAASMHDGPTANTTLLELLLVTQNLFDEFDTI